MNSLELAAIGSCLDPDTSSLAVFEAPSELFLSDEGKVLHEGVMALYQGGYAITPQSLEVYLYTEKGVDQGVAAGWVAEAMAQRSSKEDIPYLVNALRQVAIGTMTKELGEQLSSGSVKRMDDVLGRISEFTHRIGALDNQGARTYKDTIIELSNLNRVKYFSPGLGPLDNVLQFDEGAVCTIGGRSAGGKTSFALNCAVNMARAGARVGIIEVEMRRAPLASRLSGILAGLNTRSVMKGEINETEREHLRYVAESNSSTLERIRGIEPSTFNIDMLKPTLERWMSEWGCEVLVFDYLQAAMSKYFGDDYRHVTYCSRMLTAAIKETGIASVVLSQARRGQKTDGKQSDVGQDDFKGSAQIEHDSDTMVALNRSNDHGWMPGDRVMPVWCEVVKNRNGFTTKDLLHLDLPTQVFSHSGEYAKATKQPEAPKQPF